MTLDLGSRKAIKGETDFIWYPAEVDTSIRPGWFYHANEDNKVKSLYKLYKIYLNSVGGNASLLLNIPPDKTGKIHAEDAMTLDSFGRLLKREFPENLLKNARASATSETDAEHSAKFALSDDERYWQAALDDERPELIVDFGKEIAFDSVILQENIATGQQIEEFDMFVQKKGSNRWKRIGKYTIIGYKRICRLKKAYITRKIRIRVRSHRGKATLLRVCAYKRDAIL